VPPIQSPKLSSHRSTALLSHAPVPPPPPSLSAWLPPDSHAHSEDSPNQLATARPWCCQATSQSLLHAGPIVAAAARVATALCVGLPQEQQALVVSAPRISHCSLMRAAQLRLDQDSGDAAWAIDRFRVVVPETGNELSGADDPHYTAHGMQQNGRDAGAALLSLL